MAWFTGLPEAAYQGFMMPWLDNQKTQKEDARTRQQGDLIRKAMLNILPGKEREILGTDPSVIGSIAPQIFNQANTEAAWNREDTKTQKILAGWQKAISKEFPTLGQSLSMLAPEELSPELMKWYYQTAKENGEMASLQTMIADTNRKLKALGSEGYDFTTAITPQAASAALQYVQSEYQYLRNRTDKKTDTAESRAYDAKVRGMERQQDWEDFTKKYDYQHKVTFTPNQEDTFNQAAVAFQNNPELAKAFIGVPTADKDAQSQISILNKKISVMSSSDESLAALTQKIYSAAEQVLGKETRYNNALSETKQIIRENQSNEKPPTQQVIEYMTQKGLNKGLQSKEGGVGGWFKKLSNDPVVGLLPAGASGFRAMGSTVAPLARTLTSSGGKGVGDLNTPAFMRNGVNITRPGPQDLSMIKYEPPYPTNQPMAPALPPRPPQGLLPPGPQGVPSGGFPQAFNPGLTPRSPEEINLENIMNFLRQIQGQNLNIPSGL